jgi:hypothetical protein
MAAQKQVLFSVIFTINFFNHTRVV